MILVLLSDVSVGQKLSDLRAGGNTAQSLCISIFCLGRVRNLVCPCLNITWVKSTALTMYWRRDARPSITVSTVVVSWWRAEIVHILLLFVLVVHLTIKSVNRVSSAILALRVWDCEAIWQQYLTIQLWTTPKTVRTSLLTFVSRSEFFSDWN